MNTIKEWQEEDRPREKLRNKGVYTLSNAELLAIIINSGSKDKSALDLAMEVLSSVNNNLLELSTKNIHFLLSNFKGIGEAKAISIIAALELGRRRGESTLPIRPKISSSKDAFTYISKDICDLTYEEIWVVLLNTSGKVIAKHKISEGGISSTNVDIRKVVKIAVEHSSAGLIMAHNHPSGNLQPSSHDIALTRKVKQALQLFDIKLFDHIIVFGNEYLSFTDENLV